jgi:hypothetical protein
MREARWTIWSWMKVVAVLAVLLGAAVHVTRLAGGNWVVALALALGFALAWVPLLLAAYLLYQDLLLIPEMSATTA